MRRSITITERLILNFLLLSLAAILIIGIYSYYTSRDAILSRTYDHLTSVRTAKKKYMEYFFKARSNEILLLQQSQEVSAMLSHLENKCIESKDQGKERTDLLNSILFRLHQSKAWERLYLVHSNGHMASAGIKDRPGGCTHDSLSRHPALARLLDSCRLRNAVHFSDYLADAGGTPALLMACPVRGSDTGFLGIIALQISPSTIDEIMLENVPEDGMGQSGESYLVGPELLMRSQSRFIDSSLMKTRVETPAVLDALKDGQGTLRIPDYRGVDVLNSHSPLDIPGLNWVIMAEIDYREAMLPVTDLRNKILFLTVFISLIVFLSIYFISRKITRPIVRLKKAAEDIGNGRFDTRLEVVARDEIGSLTTAFNSMTDRVRQITDDLKEREERLKHFYDATLDGILLHDDEEPLLVNQALCKLTGYSEKELMSMKVSDIFQQEKKSPFRIPLRPYTYETTAQKKRGRAFPVEIQVSEIEYGNKMILASIIRDITRRMEVEEELRQERLKRLSWVIDGQEIERERLSRELHDGLGQMLVAIKLELESAIDHEDAKTKSVIRDLRTMFDKTIDEIRRISNDLMPSGLQEFGITNALRKLGSLITENSGIEVFIEVENPPEALSNKTIMYLYRIAQEAINNSVKHANPSEIHVKLSCNEQFISLEVADNGKGFKFDKTHKFVGNGIYNMRERVNMMEGMIDIRSVPGEGTVVSVQIPANK